jgi:hypothetical protein
MKSMETDRQCAMIDLIFVDAYLILIIFNKNLKSVNGTTTQQSRTIHQLSTRPRIYTLLVGKLFSI